MMTTTEPTGHKVEILEKRKDQLVLRVDDGPIFTRPLTHYTEMKYLEYKGERIMYNFNENCWVQETYDDGIFNCQFDRQFLQISDKDQIAFAIKMHRDHGSLVEFQAVFGHSFLHTYPHKIVRSMFAGYADRIKLISEDDGLVEIDEMFAVDKFGIAYVVDNSTEIPTKDKAYGKYKRLCIVPAKKVNSKLLTVQTQYGVISLDEDSQFLMSKIAYLMNPKLSDGVLMGQLPAWVKARLKKKATKDAEAEQNSPEEGNI